MPYVDTKGFTREADLAKAKKMSPTVHELVRNLSMGRSLTEVTACGRIAEHISRLEALLRLHEGE